MTLKNITILLLILSVIQFVLIGWLWVKQQDYQQQTNDQQKTFMQYLSASMTATSYQQVTVSPPEDRVYFPQLGIYIPSSASATALVYSPSVAYASNAKQTRSDHIDQANISTFLTINTPQTQAQFDCSALVRLKLEAKPNPYNPHEIPSGSVALANGQTLQIYANHLRNCAGQWTMANADPDAVAKLFAEAQSY